MVPGACCEEFLEALTDGDDLVASHHLDELATWINRSGFIPEKIAARLTPATDLARLLTSATVVLAWAAHETDSEGD